LLHPLLFQPVRFGSRNLEPGGQLLLLIRIEG
jgi:hypothetical protein